MVYHDEQFAYGVQSSVNFVFNKYSVSGVWNPAWVKTDGPIIAQQKRKDGIDKAAQRSTDATFNINQAQREK